MLNESLRHGLAVNYHENTKKIDNLGLYDNLQQYKIYPSAKTTIVEAHQFYDKSDFVRVLYKRQSHRLFEKQGITFAQLGKLLSLSFGFNYMTESDIRFRTYPSAGGRYPIEVYLAILHSEDLSPGIYHYNVVDNSIELIRAGQFENELRGFYANQPISGDAPCYILFSMVLERTMHKYGERGYRFVYLDAGHMGQNLYLVAEYLGLGVVAFGGGNDSDKDVDELLLINDQEESFFYGFAVGIPEKNDNHIRMDNK